MSQNQKHPSLPVLERLRGILHNVGITKQEHQPMYRAAWNEQILAESDRTIVVEGNHYFPPDSISREFFFESNSHTTCPWKGLASYYDIQVNGKINKNAAWYYPAPKEAAQQIKDYVAFWHGVKVLQVDEQAIVASQ